MKSKIKYSRFCSEIETYQPIATSITMVGKLGEVKLMKKFFRVFICALLLVLIGSNSLPSYAKADSKPLTVYLDEIPIRFDVQPIIKDDRTLVPFRAAAEALNVNVSWDGSTQTVSASDGKISIRLQIGNKIAYVNEIPFTLDVPPLIVNDRTLIPLRFFTEALGCKVTWDGNTNSVYLALPPKSMSVIGFYAHGDSNTSSWTDLFGKNYPMAEKGNTELVSDLALGWYSLDKNGILLAQSDNGWNRPDGWEQVLEKGKQFQLKTEMAVFLNDQSNQLSSLLANQTAMQQAIAQIIQESKFYQGVNLDFEGLGLTETGEDLKKVQQKFTDFVRLLDEQLSQANKTLTLTLHPLNSAYKGYDYQTLGLLSDRIIIMAYEYGQSPEPVDKVQEAVELAKVKVPSEKLMLGILIPNETPQSVLVKIGIAKRYNLGGIALWRLGVLSDEMWNSLRSTIKTRRIA